VAIDAIDFHGGAWLTVNFSIAMIVLFEVAVIALHPFSKMDVGEVDGLAEAGGIGEGELFPILVEPVPFSIMIENSAENPAVSVEVGELRGFQLLVEFGATGFSKKLFVAPEAASGCRFGIP
jgi:hypothetical protein